MKNPYPAKFVIRSAPNQPNRQSERHQLNNNPKSQSSTPTTTIQQKHTTTSRFTQLEAGGSDQDENNHIFHNNKIIRASTHLRHHSQQQQHEDDEAAAFTAIQIQDHRRSRIQLQDDSKVRRKISWGARIMVIIIALVLISALILCSLIVLPPGNPILNIPYLNNSQHPAKHSEIPTILQPYYQSSLFNVSTNISYHNPFFNELYMRDRSTPWHDSRYLNSHLALPHAFHTPLPYAQYMFASTMVVGVFCYDVDRIELIIDTWGKYLEAAHLMIFTEVHSDPIQQARQARLKNVYILDNSKNQHRNTTDRRASAWKIFPALQLMFEHFPIIDWYYLCDDDSWPVIHQLFQFASTFYAQYPNHAPTTQLYLGESVQQTTFFKGYYADEKGRNVALAYHCTGGGVLMNNALVKPLIPFLSNCFVFFASDLSLGYCIQQSLPNVTMLDIPNQHHLYARTIEEVTARFGPSETVIWNAGAFHHMREPFISKWGIDSRLEFYLRQSEWRTYHQYLYSLLIMNRFKETIRTQQQQQPSPTNDQQLHAGSSFLSLAVVNMRVLVILLAPLSILQNSGTPLREWMIGLLQNDAGMMPLSWLADFSLDTDVLVIDDATTSSSCDNRCQLYALNKSCQQMYIDAKGIMVSHIQQLNPAEFVQSTLTTLRQISYTVYHLIISLDAVIPANIIQQYNTSTFFTHYVHRTCLSQLSSSSSSSSSLVAISSFPAAGYSLYLRDQLSAYDTRIAVNSHVIDFPLIQIHYGLFHALKLTAEMVELPLTDSRTHLLISATTQDQVNEYSQQIGAAYTGPTQLLPIEQPINKQMLNTLATGFICVFLTDLNPATNAIANTSALTSIQKQSLVNQILFSIAAGCLVIITDTLASLPLSTSSSVTATSAVDYSVSLRLLFSPSAVVSSRNHLNSLILQYRTVVRDYGVEVAGQRAALNAHLLEKPWHNLFMAMQRHFARHKAVV